jgi:flagellar hook assembly protein FlgD
MNRLLSLGIGIFFTISAAFAVDWVKESASFEFPATGVKSRILLGSKLNFTTTHLPGKKQMMLKYTLPANATNAVINIYAINGVRVNSFKLDNKSSSVAWNISKRAAGTYTAELKTETALKTIRFVIAH